ncbi:hypothetical protein IW261DRAFT_100680 [Armillaria novae-zelandiae]|uniref:Uncharacterized protein n=1 Tax=Armillaria novae-zelandiae TaxID=153914 RepID=A0AA39PW31_9AGAR|nr:hypothetical protein IW261DRAFT_100680 [Armillaria novae-zelandiae]
MVGRRARRGGNGGGTVCRAQYVEIRDNFVTAVNRVTTQPCRTVLGFHHHFLHLHFIIVLLCYMGAYTISQCHAFLETNVHFTRVSLLTRDLTTVFCLLRLRLSITIVLFMCFHTGQLE